MEPFDYDRGDIHLRYDSARNFSAEALGLWTGRLAAHAPRAGFDLIVDVGCGTGRFSAALAERFGAAVCAVDLSQKMLEVARETAAQSPAGDRVRLLRGSAEALPLADGCGGLVFLSMVFHHLRDRRRACAEFARVLRAGGRAAVRAATRERLDSQLWLAFFPEAREIELGRTPAVAELTSAFEGAGFRLAAHETVNQPFADDPREYASKIALRGLSPLQAIPDAAFAAGAARLRAHCEARAQAGPIHEEIDFFVFDRPAPGV